MANNNKDDFLMTYLFRSYCTFPSGVLMVPETLGTDRSLSSLDTNGTIVC